MFCPNREKSNFSLPICLMFRITLQNAFGDKLHNIRDKMIRGKCQMEVYISNPNHDFLFVHKKIIFCKEKEKWHLHQANVKDFCFFSLNWYFQIVEEEKYCAKRIDNQPLYSWKTGMPAKTKSMLCSPSLNIFVALAKILVSYALGIFGGALVQSQIMGQGLGEPHSAHLISLNRTIPMLMRTKIIHNCSGRETQVHWRSVLWQIWQRCGMLLSEKKIKGCFAMWLMNIFEEEYFCKM